MYILYLDWRKQDWTHIYMDGGLIKYYDCNYCYFKYIDLVDDSSLHLRESNINTYIFCVTYFIYGIISSPIPNYIRKMESWPT